MEHSIISFLTKDGILIDFHRLRQKRPKTVLNIVFREFQKFESLYLSDKMRSTCATVEIHYTDYDTTEDNLTYRCTFSEFIEMYNAYKQYALVQKIGA